ncbi:hypothetical protein MMC07_006961 [Pseudocyphellaria aurata]|nr:hypothetical protein [Pseudocyphellaria aurata]
MGDDPEVFRWLLDVRLLWPVPEHSSQTASHATGPVKSDSTAHWATGEDAKFALSMLSSPEKANVLRFHFPRDAKLSLASTLLKHRAITHVCNVSWSQAVIGEDHNRKPCYKPKDAGSSTLEFNVSHHGTLVTLVGCAGQTRKLGTDIAQMNWVKDYPSILKDGFAAFVKVYASVFSDREVADMIAYSPPGSSNLQDRIKAKLRHFYAHWCLREAYVKMTGEALLAPWLKDLEFRNVQVPLPSNPSSHGTEGENWGQTCSADDIWFKGKKLTDVKVELQAFGEEYLIATAVSEPHPSLSAFKELDLQRDVFPQESTALSS